MIPTETIVRTYRAQQSTNALADRYDEIASATAVLGEMASPITITQEGCRSLAKLLRDHAGMIGDMRQLLVYETTRADAKADQLVRALVLIDQIKGFGFWDLVAFWRKMRADSR